VVGVVAPLAVVGIAYTAAWERSQNSEPMRVVRCLNNERLLGKAFAQYVADNDGVFPCGTHPAPLRGLSSGWAGQIYPYVKSEDAYRCPDDRTEPDSVNPYQVPVSYAYNWNVGNVSLPLDTSTMNALNPATNVDIGMPEKTVLLCEASGTTADISDSHGIEASSPAVLGMRSPMTSSIDGKGDGLRYATGVLLCDPASSAIVGGQTGNALSVEGVHLSIFYASNYLLSDGHVRTLNAIRVSAGMSNPVSSIDCTAGQGLQPVGVAGSGYAAGTQCAGLMAATFSIR